MSAGNPLATFCGLRGAAAERGLEDDLLLVVGSAHFDVKSEINFP